ncbi:MAG: hypothetical protein GOV00_03235 [Candidatus Altiarchaeota archaeon]|nr:hypothetical protein [Candidatus Altiarchaeota archaeon]
MCRGMFNMILFLLMASTTINLYAIHATLINQELESQATYLDAEELFYIARNFESDFFQTSTSTEKIVAWYSVWSSQQPPIYGYFSHTTSTCVQVEESFEVFVNRVFRFENKSMFMEAYGEKESCIFLSLEKGGFKTFGVLKSPICTECN